MKIKKKNIDPTDTFRRKSSSNNPNLQNIPRRTKEGKELIKAFSKPVLVEINL